MYVLNTLILQMAYEGFYELMTNPNLPHDALGSIDQFIQYGYALPCTDLAPLDDYTFRYVPSNGQTGTASLTLDYSMDNWATGMIGQSMGISGSEVFVQRAQNYRNIWDHTTQYFCPRNTNGVCLYCGLSYYCCMLTSCSHLSARFRHHCCGCSQARGLLREIRSSIGGLCRTIFLAWSACSNRLNSTSRSSANSSQRRRLTSAIIMRGFSRLTLTQHHYVAQSLLLGWQ